MDGYTDRQTESWTDRWMHSMDPDVQNVEKINVQYI